eukprot:CAMPEP_0119495112 /NCGR_PEP_ID=MMETSP1344-20130328/18854_1 /TAXON_ID=236787 /ORGANISM="Florenciella parvula, Strain CCMP2471" /LENGTH=57 /DNA_ID=CAMNT_0007530675 /DNA_START=82 /DNA_END=253 /DNA_ORIENTATION=-
MRPSPFASMKFIELGAEGYMVPVADGEAGGEVCCGEGTAGNMATIELEATAVRLGGW